MDEYFLEEKIEAKDFKKIWTKQPLVAIFWRTGCSTCRFTLPYFDKIQQAYPDSKILGISQDDYETTESFCISNEITFENIVDTGYKLSHKLGLSTVPTYYLIDTYGKIIEHGMGFDKAKINHIAELIAEKTGEEYSPIITQYDQVPDFSPG